MLALGAEADATSDAEPLGGSVGLETGSSPLPHLHPLSPDNFRAQRLFCFSGLTTVLMTVGMRLPDFLIGCLKLLSSLFAMFLRVRAQISRGFTRPDCQRFGQDDVDTVTPSVNLFHVIGFTHDLHPARTRMRLVVAHSFPHYSH